MDQLWDSIRQRVCRKCIDGDSKGGCRLPVDETCALQTFFPEIVETVSGVHSGSYQDYVNALRTRICKSCEHQFSSGFCARRNSIECALDRYYPVIIDVIESIKTPAVGAGPVSP